MLKKLYAYVFFALFLFLTVAFTTGETSTASDAKLPLLKQEQLARTLFKKTASMEKPDLIEIVALLLRVVEEAPDTKKAEEAYWMLSNIYMQSFDPPRNSEAIALLEQYLVRYPESGVLDAQFVTVSIPRMPLVKKRLLLLYEKEDLWEKTAALYAEIIPDPNVADEGLLEYLIGYGQAMEKTGQTEKAVAAYKAFLERNGGLGDFLEDFAKERLREIRSAVPLTEAAHYEIRRRSLK